VLGASSNADTSGAGTIQYTDGTVQSYNLTIDNWFYAPDSASDTTIATTPYINDSTRHGDGGVIGKRKQTVRVFAATISLLPGKTASSVTLPTISNSLSGDAMHIFALGVG
jgi:beta-glucosidase